jgi:hypothetical protein
MWAHRTNGNASSSSESWATPEAMVRDNTTRRTPAPGRAEGTRHGESPTGMMPDGTKRQVDLQHQVRLWQTPNVMDSSNRMIQNQRGDPTKPVPTLAGQCRSFPQAPATSTPGDESSNTTPASRRRLNPRFVCWLMGWPLIGGNGSDSLGTESCRFKRRMRSRLSRLVSD